MERGSGAKHFLLLAFNSTPEFCYICLNIVALLWLLLLFPTKNVAIIWYSVETALKWRVRCPVKCWLAVDLATQFIEIIKAIVWEWVHLPALVSTHQPPSPFLPSLYYKRTNGSPSLRPSLSHLFWYPSPCDFSRRLLFSYCFLHLHFQYYITLNTNLKFLY